MKKFLLAGVAAAAVAGVGFTTFANAADVRMPTKVRPLVPVSVHTWTGCYLGGHVGLAAGHTTWADPIRNGAIDATLSAQTANTDMSGGLYGGQITVKRCPVHPIPGAGSVQ